MKDIAKDFGEKHTIIYDIEHRFLVTKATGDTLRVIQLPQNKNALVSR